LRKVKVQFEFLPWDHMEYRYQIEEYFKIVRKLNNEGLNPKANCLAHIVFNAYIVEAFLPCSNKFKTTNSPRNKEGFNEAFIASLWYRPNHQRNS